MWKGQTLKIPRYNLYLLEKQGIVNLRNLKIQGQALLLHRTIQLLCTFTGSFSSGMCVMSILKDIELVLPLNIQT